MSCMTQYARSLLILMVLTIQATEDRWIGRYLAALCFTYGLLLGVIYIVEYPIGPLSKRAMDVSEFKQVYNKEGSHDLKVQIPFLENLAKHYEELGRENPRRDWTAVLKAHALYNSCAARCSDRDKMKHFTEKAFEVQNCYVKFTQGRVSSLDHLHKLRESHVSHLEEIRLSAQKGITPVAEQISLFDLQPQMIGMSPNTELIEKCVNILEPVVTQQSDGMIDLSRKIIRDSVALMREPPPCEFEAVALGSMSRGESTPYSDLEFLFLLEHKDKAITEYFETLALTVYFLIGNIQETKLKYMAIDELSGWFTDEAKNGFKIDGLQKKAGNIPTGNGSTNAKNKFICTVQGLTEYYKSVFQNPPNQDKDITGDDSDLLTFTRLIYHHSTKRATGGMLLEAFTDHLSSIAPNKKRKEAAQQTLDKDLANHFFQPTTSDTMQILAKSNICRFPSLIIMNLKIKRRIQILTATNTSDDLHVHEFVDKDFSVTLKKANMFAMFIRLSCYLHHNSQQEDIDLLDPRVRKDGGVLPKKLYIVYNSLVLEILSFLFDQPIDATASRCESVISVAFNYCNRDEATKYANFLMLMKKFDRVLVPTKMALLSIYRLRRLYEKATSIIISAAKDELEHFDVTYVFQWRVKMWCVLSEMQEKGAAYKMFESTIKQSSEVEQQIFFLIKEAHDMQSLIVERDRKKVVIDTDFMEQILRRRSSFDSEESTYAWAHLREMQGQHKESVKWAEKFLKLYEKKTDMNEDSVSKNRHYILQFLACQCFKIRQFIKSEGYAKKCLVIGLKLDEHPPRYQGRMYNVLHLIYLDRRDIVKATAAIKKAKECWDKEAYRDQH